MVWDCDNVQDYRKLEQEGKGIYDAPIYDPEALEISVPSMHGSHEVHIRMIEPKSSTPRGVFMYIHGGLFENSSN
jgi:acetyl esterase/lipase